MKTSPRYRMPFKRRLKEKTDYEKRKKLLYSRKPRLVVRRSLKYVRAQVVKFDLKGDETLVSASSRELKKFGWEGSTSNVPSAYLVGLLIGERTLKKGIKSVILDLGLRKSTKESRIYATLKGAIDSGLKVSHSEEIFPSGNRTSGKHVLDYAEKLMKEDVEKFKRQFSLTRPQKTLKAIERIKSKIIKD